MKRFLSIMLSVMLVMSSFVMVSGEEYLDPVITVDVTEGATYEFGTIFDGYYDISIKVYAPQGVTEATMVAKNGEEGEPVASIDLPLNTNGGWQTVTLGVNGAFDRVAFTAKGEKFYVSYFSVDKVYAKNLLFEENFEFDKVGEDLPYVTYLKPIHNNHATQLVTGTDEKKTSFTVAENIGDKTTKVGNLYNPYHSSSDVRRYNDAGEFIGDGENNMYKTDTTNNNSTANEHYVIDVPAAKDATHIVAEFEVYNAANAIHHSTGAVLDTLHFSVANLKATHNSMSEMAKLEIIGPEFRLTGKAYDGTGADSNKVAHGVEPKTWNKVTYEIKRETYVDTADSITKWKITSKVTYNGKTITNVTHRAAADDFGRIFISVPYTTGGRFYIDNLKLYSVSEMEDAYISRYSEDFDGEDDILGQPVNGSSAYFYTTPTTNTFTVAASYDSETNPDGGISGNSSQYGRLYNPRYGSTATNDYTKLKDNEIDEDNGRTYYSTSNESKISIAIPIKGMEAGWGTTTVGESKKTRIKFKYYLPETTIDGNGANRNTLEIGMGRGNTHQSGDVPKIYPLKADGTVTLTQRGASSANVTTNYQVYSTNNTSGPVTKLSTSKVWIPVILDITSTYTGMNGTNPAYDHAVKFTSLYAESDVANVTNNAPDLNILVFGNNYTSGGHVYLDDIEVLTNVLSEEDYAKIDKHTENVYLKKAITQNPNGEFRIDKGTLSDSEQQIFISKGHSYTTDANFVLALFDKDGVLVDASVNNLPLGTINPFSDKAFNLTDLVEVPETLDGEYYKAFIFNTVDGLKPLADMFNDSKNKPNKITIVESAATAE